MTYTRPVHAGLLLSAAILASPAMAADWKENSITLGYQIDAFDKCRGRLAERPRFSGCVKMWDDAYRRWNRMSAQATQRLAKDPANANARGLVERSGGLGRRLDAATDFMQPEIRQLGPAKVRQFVASEKLLAKYRAPLEAVLAAPPGKPVDPRALWKN